MPAGAQRIQRATGRCLRTWKPAAVALVAGAVALVMLRPAGPQSLVKRILAWNVNRQRSRLRSRLPPFAHLAASQVGYAPGMRKLFTSPSRFDTFQVVREGDGAVVLQGGAPVRELAARLPGTAGSVFVGDFSALRAEGRYRIVTAAAESHPFDVGPHVFDAAIRAVQRGFYFQRAFTAIDARHAEGPWVHASDAASAPPGVVRGWHDAGDFSIYSASLNSALFWMLDAFRDFSPAGDDTNIPESGNGIPDLLDEARWGLDWLLSVQQGSGAFLNSVCEEQYGPYGTNVPERMPRYHAGEPGTLATARAVGNLAYASTLYRPFDAAFSERALLAARRGYDYLAQQGDAVTDGPTCPAYRADGDARVGRQARMFAAAGLLLATGERRFDDEFARFQVELDPDPGYLHFGGLAARLYLRAAGADPARKADLRRGIRVRAAQVREEGRADPFQRAGPTHWGSVAASLTRTNASSAAVCLEDPDAAPDDCDQALANLHAMLGRNYLQLCYVSGLPGTSDARRHAFHHWLAALNAQPFLFPGMVAGGPNLAPDPADRSNPLARPIPVWGYWGDPAFPRGEETPFDGRYTDNDSWSTNEVSLDWQAPALYALYFARWMAGDNRPPLRGLR
jgi:endoglucanase